MFVADEWVAMAKYRWHEDGFIKDVANHRGLRLHGNAGSGWRLEGALGGTPWTTTLTPASGETPPSIVWRCPGLRAGSDDLRQLRVGRSSGGGSTFGNVEGGAVGLVAAGAILAIGSLFGRRKQQAPPVEPRSDPDALAAPGGPAGGPAGGGQGVLGAPWQVIDPSGVLDASLAPLFSTWPVAWWGPDDERPAELSGVWLNQQGLEVSAQDWWCSAPALDQLIMVGVTVAERLRRAGF